MEEDRPTWDFFVTPHGLIKPYYVNILKEKEAGLLSHANATNEHLERLVVKPWQDFILSLTPDEKFMLFSTALQVTGPMLTATLPILRVPGNFSVTDLHDFIRKGVPDRVKDAGCFGVYAPCALPSSLDHILENAGERCFLFVLLIWFVSAYSQSSIYFVCSEPETGCPGC